MAKVAIIVGSDSDLEKASQIANLRNLEAAKWNEVSNYFTEIGK